MSREIARLHALTFLGNWPVKPDAAKKAMVRGLGSRIEEVASDVAEVIATAQTGAAVGRAAEKPCDATRELTLRIIEPPRGLHRSKVDVVFVKKGGDLFIGFEVEARTWIKYLKWITASTISACTFVGLLVVYLNMTNAYVGIVDEYVRQGASALEAGRAAAEGWRVNPVTHEWEKAETVTFVGVLRRSPRTVFTHLGTPATICAALSAGLAFALTKPSLIHVCRAAGCPAPTQFDDFISASGSWVLGMTYRVLFDQYGVSESDRISC